MSSLVNVFVAVGKYSIYISRKMQKLCAHEKREIFEALEQKEANI
jgi:hypothetical protein